jgi:hypothetical protein
MVKREIEKSEIKKKNVDSNTSRSVTSRGRVLVTKLGGSHCRFVKLQ